VEEKTVWAGTSSQWTNLGAYILCVLSFAAFATGFVLLHHWIAQQGTFVAVVFVIVTLIPLGVMMAKWTILKAKRYEITTERIKTTTGIFSKQTSVVELYRVKDYILKEPFFYRIFHLGSIEIITSDPSTHDVFIEAVPNGRKLFDEIRQHVEARRDAKGVREIDFDRVENLPK
jgi:membrane protein YdbS with pleckstrin-like domain